MYLEHLHQIPFSGTSKWFPLPHLFHDHARVIVVQRTERPVAFSTFCVVRLDPARIILMMEQPKDIICLDDSDDDAEISEITEVHLDILVGTNKKEVADILSRILKLLEKEIRPMKFADVERLGDLGFAIRRALKRYPTDKEIRDRALGILLRWAETQDCEIRQKMIIAGRELADDLYMLMSSNKEDIIALINILRVISNLLTPIPSSQHKDGQAGIEFFAQGLEERMDKITSMLGSKLRKGSRIRKLWREVQGKACDIYANETQNESVVKVESL